MKAFRQGYPAVYYSDGTTPVQIGDEVETRVFFKKTSGQVAYVPGISPVNPEMEFNGLTYVGIRTVDQGIMGVTVMPNSSTIKKSIKFLRRGKESGFREVNPDEHLFEDEEGNPL